MPELSLLESVAVTFGVFIAMIILCCIFCYCMELSDIRMKRYIIKTAKRKGLRIDESYLEPRRPCHNCQNEQTPMNEVCAIVIPEVGIVH